MTKIPFEVLEEIELRRQRFRDQARPLSTEAVDEIARAWLHLKRTFWERQEVTGTFWPALALGDLLDSEPESALAVLGRALDLEPGPDIEFEVFEELQPLVRKHLQFLQLRLPGFLASYEPLRARLLEICRKRARPYGWTDEQLAQLCGCLGQSAI